MTASNETQQDQMGYLLRVGKLSALICLAFVVFLFFVTLRVSLGQFLAAVGLICVAGTVVGALIALSFQEEEHEPE